MPQKHFVCQTRDFWGSSRIRSSFQSEAAAKQNVNQVADVEVADVVAIGGSGHTEAPLFTNFKKTNPLNNKSNKQDYTEI